MRRYAKIFTGIIAAMLFALPLCACGDSTEDTHPAQGITIESAYAQAVDLGYTGTLEQFIEAISGKDGVSIESVELNDDGELVITDSNGNVLFKKKLPLCDHAYSAQQIGILPTCTSHGYNLAVCDKCGDIEYIPVEALGHDWDNGTVVFEPNCIKNGLTYYTCEVCGETKSQILPATGEHKFKNDVCIYCNASYRRILDDRYNTDYGYEYLSNMTGGALFCRLYDAIDGYAMDFHSDGSLNATADGDEYVLAQINYAALGLTDDQAVSVWKTYTDDNPLYYWMSKTLQVRGENIVLFVEPEYANGSDRIAYNEKLYSIINEYEDMAQNESAYTVALAYHDAIINKIDYAYKNGNAPEDAAWAHNVTGVLEGKGAVCEGYARTFQLLLNARGIDNIFVDGTSRNQNHAWNLVQLDDGEWYWYDLTWDDTPGYYWGMQNNYTCATDEEFLKNHTPSNDGQFGVDFLYGLPERATSAYDGDEPMLSDKITVDGNAYEIIGYNSLNLSKLSATDENQDVTVPRTVEYSGRTFNVISLMNKTVGDGCILVHNKFYNSINIPSTVVYIDDGAISDGGLKSITVDDDNKIFCAENGVLFTQFLNTLVYYPEGKTNESYSVPVETYYIAAEAFRTGRTKSKLQELHIGKNVKSVGCLNDGYGYPGFGGLAGAWNQIIMRLVGQKKFTVDKANPYFKIENDMLMSTSGHSIYAALPNIERAEIPDTVNYIDTCAFSNLQQLKYAKIPSGIEWLSRTFNNCSNLTEVILSEGLIQIKDTVFKNCKSLENIILPDSLKLIDYQAFYGCTSLKSITIPKNVEKIASNAFNCCTSLAEITVSAENTHYISKGNCIIESATKTLVSGCNTSIINDDGSVTSIADHAFYGSDIETIVLPETVKSIGKYVFSYCSSLKAIVISKSIANIDKNAFFNFRGNIFYQGTENEWYAMDSENSITGWQTVLLHFYSETEPTTSGNYWHYVDGVPVKW